MSKVICDVCGTTYPETAARCPICGSAMSAAATTAAGDGNEGSASYAYVKGGRFSKGNVRRHTQEGREYQRQASEPRPAPSRREATPGENRPVRAQSSVRQTERRSSGRKNAPEANKLLAVVVVVLLLAIVAVLIYIGIRVLGPSMSSPNNNKPGASTPAAQDPTAGSSDGARIPCTDLEVSNPSLQFVAEGQSYTLGAIPTPADTTDELYFDSTDEGVVIVDDTGKITAVGNGTARIIVTCGGMTAECEVTCAFSAPSPSDPTDPSTPPATEPVKPGGYVLELNRSDFTLGQPGDSWMLFDNNGTVKATDIIWTSEKPEVAIVESGKVVAVGKGRTVIHASYGGQTASCIVYVQNDAPETNPDGPKLTINKTDVTIAVGETFELTLKDEAGNVVTVQWVASQEGVVTIDGNKITGAGYGTIRVSATVDGTTKFCIVRIPAP